MTVDAVGRKLLPRATVENGFLEIFVNMAARNRGMNTPLVTRASVSEKKRDCVREKGSITLFDLLP